MAWDDSHIDLTIIPKPEEIVQEPFASNKSLLLQYKTRIQQLIAKYPTLRPQSTSLFLDEGSRATGLVEGLKSAVGDLSTLGSNVGKLVFNWDLSGFDDTGGFKKDALTVQDMIPGSEIGVYPKLLELCESLVAINRQLNTIKQADETKARQEQIRKDNLLSSKYDDAKNVASLDVNTLLQWLIEVDKWLDTTVYRKYNGSQLETDTKMEVAWKSKHDAALKAIEGLMTDSVKGEAFKRAARNWGNTDEGKAFMTKYGGRK